MTGASKRTIAGGALAALAAVVALARLGEDRIGDGPGRPADGESALRDAMRPAASPTAPPAWAGGAVAVVAAAPDGAMIAVLAADGPHAGVAAAPRRLVGGFEAIGRFGWARDGARLAFAARRDGRWDLWAVGRDGSALRRVTNDAAYDADPAWSPDGRSLAFSSYRDGELAVYRIAVSDERVEGTAADNAGAADDAASPAAPTRLTTGDAPAIEPTWSPDGATIAFAAWHDGAYRIEAVGADGTGRRVVVPQEAPPDTEDALRSNARAGAAPPDDLPDDLRAPAWSPDGSSIGYLAGRHGATRLDVQDVSGAGAPIGRMPVTLAADASGFGWVADGRAVALLTLDRGGRRATFRTRARFDHFALADLPGDPLALASGAAAVAWTTAPPDAQLAAAAMGDGGAPAAEPTVGARTGLAELADVRVSGARVNAALLDDFTALRDEARAATGVDFLGTLSDMWRPVGFFSSESAYFSWHKTGRAFDTQMEVRGPGGRRDMVLVREDNGGGGPQWRMYLRAAAQDGTVGAPLTAPGWTFSAGGGDEAHEADGGARANTVPGGYWVDFTALAARYGWRRIASLTRDNLDWRTDWAAIEYWHYERRGGLRWFEAARQVYTDAELAAAFGPDRLRALSIPLSRLARQGFPAGWGGR